MRHESGKNARWAHVCIDNIMTDLEVHAGRTEYIQSVYKKRKKFVFL